MANANEVESVNALNPAEQESQLIGHHRMGERKLERRLTSMDALERAVERWPLREGDCLHFLTAGDIDFITFIQFVIRQQYCPFVILSSWIVSGADVKMLTEWYERGMIGRVDFVVGEIYEGSYTEAYNAAQSLIHRCGGRLATVRDHMKLAAIIGERFNVLLESSANFNLNPRAENVVLTVDEQLTKDCVNWLANIVPFNRDRCGAEPYRV